MSVLAAVAAYDLLPPTAPMLWHYQAVALSVGEPLDARWSDGAPLRTDRPLIVEVDHERTQPYTAEADFNRLPPSACSALQTDAGAQRAEMAISLQADTLAAALLVQRHTVAPATLPGGAPGWAYDPRFVGFEYSGLARRGTHGPRAGCWHHHCLGASPGPDAHLAARVLHLESPTPRTEQPEPLGVHEP